MPCLSLRFHPVFRQLCRWTSEATLKTIAPENTAPEAEVSAISDSPTQIVGETLFISHARVTFEPSSVDSDDSLADLVNAKLQSLAEPAIVIPNSQPKAQSAPELDLASDSGIASSVSTDHATSPMPDPTSNPAPQIVTQSVPKPLRQPFFAHFRRQRAPRRLSSSELLNAESRLGSTIFGPIPDGHRREFFHDKDNVWIWHESWQDWTLAERQITVRYEVRPNGIYKKYAAGRYIKLENAELTNFRRAAHAYLQVVKAGLYAPANA